MAFPYRNPLLESALARPSAFRPVRAPYQDPLLAEDDPAFHVEPPRPAEPPMPEPDWTAPQVEMSPLDGPGRMARPPVDDQIRAEPIDPFESDYNAALALRSQHAASKPIVGDKQYDRPTWQKILLMGAAGGAGYVNAGGRARVQGPSEELLRSRPKYDSAMDQWTADGRAIDSDINAMQSKYQMGRQANQEWRANRRDDATQRMQEAHARAYDAQANRPAPEPRPFGVTGGYINAKGEFVRTDSGGGKETPDQAFARREKEAAQLGLKPGTPEYVFFRANGKMPNPQRPLKGRSERPHQATAAQSIQIENRKSVALRRAEADYRKKLAEAPDQDPQLRAELERQKTQIQQDYEDQIMAAGGSINEAAPSPVPVTPPGSERTGVPAVPKASIPPGLGGPEAKPAPIGGATPPPKKPDLVRVRRPDGKTGTIPRANLAAALAAGAVELP